MLIETGMDLHELAERMGQGATLSDSARMRDLLVKNCDGQDTADICQSVWLGMLQETQSDG